MVPLLLHLPLPRLLCLPLGRFGLIGDVNLGDLAVVLGELVRVDCAWKGVWRGVIQTNFAAINSARGYLGVGVDSALGSGMGFRLTVHCNEVGVTVPGRIQPEALLPRASPHQLQVLNTC